MFEQSDSYYKSTPLNIENLRHKAKRTGKAGLLARKKLAILERDEFKCTKCGKKKNLTIDHVGKCKKFKDYVNKTPASYDLKICKTKCTRCHELKNQKSYSRKFFKRFMRE